MCLVKQPDITIGQKIVATGFPLGQDLSIRPGQVTSLSGPNGTIQTNWSARGMSGGPVLNEQQAVIGRLIPLPQVILYVVVRLELAA